ncbi:MAG: putative Ig domain-containing protein, partial [Methanosarcinaceae archaeon]|nr:putative Ig domain-containing protein [Methanosarcinaceae archaeon]
MGIFILSTLICAISIGFGSAAGESPIVVVADQIVTPNQQFTVNITIDPAVAITGAQFNLLFDSSIATVNSVIEGDLFTQDGASTIFNNGTIDNNAGTVTDVYSTILGATSISTSGTMAIINVTAGGSTGRFDLNLSNVIIADANSNAASYTITNTSVLIDTAPAFAQIGAKSVDEESALTFTVSASDADGDSLAYSASNLPAGASFNTATRVFTWTPADGQAGSYTVTFDVTDGYLTDSESVTMTVNEVNHAPAITGFTPANNAVFDETDLVIIDVTASDVDGQALSYI